MRIHKPVLLEESVELLRCERSKFYVDCTLGMAGHSERILELTAPDGLLLAIDRDREAIEFAAQRLERFKERVRMVHGDYRMLTSILSEQPVPSGILADFGASMLQFSSPHRGFSFSSDAPLDMRMDQRQKETAADIVNEAGEAELIAILRKYGEEPQARKIVRRIVEERKQRPIETTTELATLIEKVAPRRPKQRIHPATRTFQALRIAVNRELEGLDSFVFDAFDALAEGGRLVLISFHSLEDRVVKQTFQFLSAACRCSKRLLVCQCGGEPLSRLKTRKPVTPGEQEIAENPASRSAKLRAIEKIKGPAPRDLWNLWLVEH